MATALIVCAHLSGRQCRPGERIDQCRLADTGGSQQSDRLPRATPRLESCDVVGITRIERLDEQARRQSRGFCDETLDRYHGIRLRNDDDGKCARIVGDRQVALEPGDIEVAIGGRDDEEGVDVRGNQLNRV